MFHNLFRKTKIIALFLLLVTTSSCFRHVEKTGYMFDMSDYEMLEQGITSKERVLRIMGSPTIISNFDNRETWIYYAQDIKKFLFFKADIIDRKVVIIRFDNSNIIKELKKVTMDDEQRNLYFATNKTPVLEHKTGFFKSIFGNVGQIKAQ